MSQNERILVFGIQDKILIEQFLITFVLLCGYEMFYFLCIGRVLTQSKHRQKICEPLSAALDQRGFVILHEPFLAHMENLRVRKSKIKIS